MREYFSQSEGSTVWWLEFKLRQHPVYRPIRGYKAIQGHSSNGAIHVLLILLMAKTQITVLKNSLSLSLSTLFENILTPDDLDLFVVLTLWTWLLTGLYIGTTLVICITSLWGLFLISSCFLNCRETKI